MRIVLSGFALSEVTQALDLSEQWPFCETSTGQLGDKPCPGGQGPGAEFPKHKLVEEEAERLSFLILDQPCDHLCKHLHLCGKMKRKGLVGRCPCLHPWNLGRSPFTAKETLQMQLSQESRDGAIALDLGGAKCSHKCSSKRGVNYKDGSVW